MHCLQTMCSICLKYNNELLINLNSKSTDDIPLVDKLEFCIPGTHHQNSNPYFICTNCIQNLNTSYEFITLCKTNRTKYNKYILQLSNDTEYKNQHNLEISLLDIRKIGLLDHLELEIKQETIEESENVLEHATVVENYTLWDHDYCATQYDEIVNNFEIVIKRSDSPETIGIENKQNEDDKMQTEIKEEVLENDPAKSQCVACKKYFSSRHQYIVHFKIRVYQIYREVYKKYKCCTCFKSFMTRRTLYDHILTHTESPPPTDTIKNKETTSESKGKFKCHMCAKQFRLRLLFEDHLQSHKVYSCHICPKKLFHQGKFNEHLKLHGSSKYTCKLSNDKNKITLKREGSKFECQICNKSFTTRRGVISHSKTHTKIYCKICNKLCFNQKAFWKHTLIHRRKRNDNTQNMLQKYIIPQSTNMNAIFNSNALKESTENLTQEVNITTTKQNTNTNDVIYMNDPKESIGNLQKENYSNQQINDSNITLTKQNINYNDVIFIDNHEGSTEKLKNKYQEVNITTTKQNTNTNDVIYMNDPKESIGNQQKENYINQQINDSNITVTKQNTNTNDVIYMNDPKESIGNQQKENYSNQQINDSNITVTKQNTNMIDVIYSNDKKKSTNITVCRICNKRCVSRLQLREHILAHINKNKSEKKYTEVNLKNNQNLTENIQIPQSNTQKESAENLKKEDQQVNTTTTKQNTTTNDVIYINDQKHTEVNLENNQNLTENCQIPQSNTQKESAENLKKEDQQVNITTTKQNTNTNDVIYINDQKESIGNCSNQQINDINITVTEQNTKMTDVIYINTTKLNTNMSNDQNESTKNLKKENQLVNVSNIQTKQNILYSNDQKQSTKDLKTESFSNQQKIYSNITLTKQNKNMNAILYSNDLQQSIQDLKKENCSNQQKNYSNITLTKQNINMNAILYSNDQKQSTKDLKKENCSNQQQNDSNITLTKQNTNLNDVIYIDGSTEKLKRKYQEVNITTTKQTTNINDILCRNQKESIGNLKKENCSNQQQNDSNITLTKQNTNYNDVIFIDDHEGSTEKLKKKYQEVNITTTKQTTNINDILCSNQKESIGNLIKENCSNQQKDDRKIIVEVVEKPIKTFTLKMNSNPQNKEDPNMQKENVLKVPDNKTETTNLQDTTLTTENNIKQNLDEKTCQTRCSFILDDNVPSQSQTNSTTELKSEASAISEQKIMQCKFCKQKFDNKNAIVAHYSSLKINELKKCTKIYTCCICKVIFNVKKLWQRHMTLHQRKIFSCNRCPKTYILKSAYDKHRSLHVKQRYLCMVCYFKFDSEEQLKDHFASAHSKKKDPETKTSTSI